MADLGLHHGRPEYRVRIGPVLGKLRHVRRSRIFQNLSVPNIVAKVLAAGNVEHRLALSGNYPKREHCVQYRESDLDFVLRLLESEGIFFFFEHGRAGAAVAVAGPAAGEPACLAASPSPPQPRQRPEDPAGAIR